jgi:outer membrane translocation and assembly module TamA
MAIVIYLLIAVLAAALPAAAQSTRVEAIAEEQAEKARQLGTEGPSDAELVIRRVLLSPLLNGGEGVYPWFGSLYAGTGMGLGVGFLKRFENAAYVNLQSGIALNNSRLLRGTFAAPELWRGKMQFETNAQWLDARGVSFYGFGQDSDRLARERSDFSPKDIGANVTVKPMRFVSVNGGYTFMNFDTERDAPRFFGADAPGMDVELNYHVTRGTIAFDWRPAPAYSTRGGYYRATFERNQEAKGLPYSFSAQEYEVVQLLPLVREQFILAAHGLMTLTSPDGGDDVPVMLAPHLGSGSALRGYANRRFTDRNRVLLTGEYRWRPSRYLDMALFLDAGQVARDRHDFNVEEFDVAWGIGARFHGPTFNALRIEVARGREGFRLIFAGSQPF